MPVHELRDRVLHGLREHVELVRLLDREARRRGLGLALDQLLVVAARGLQSVQSAGPQERLQDRRQLRAVHVHARLRAHARLIGRETFRRSSAELLYFAPAGGEVFFAAANVAVRWE